MPTLEETRRKVQGIKDLLAADTNKQTKFKKLKGSSLLEYVTSDPELTSLNLTLTTEDMINILKDNEAAVPKPEPLTRWFFMKEK